MGAILCRFKSCPAHQYLLMKKKQEQEIEQKYIPHLFVIILISIIGFLVYYSSLKGVFVFDDKALILDNPFIKNFSHIKDIFTTQLFKGSGIYSNFYRPIQSLSFMIDYHLWGLNPYGYHLTGIFIHILNAIFVYFLTYRIFKKQDIALITSLLFCVHTVLSWPVDYIASRADLLSPFFFLAALLLYILYRENNNGVNQRFRHKIFKELSLKSPVSLNGSKEPFLATWPFPWFSLSLF